MIIQKITKSMLKSIGVLLIFLALLFILYGKFFNYENKNLSLAVYGLATTSVIFMTFLITYLKYKDPSETIRRKYLSLNEKPFVSCIVAVYNEEKLIIPCVQSLIGNTYPNKEIILVNDASTDSTKEKLEHFKNKEIKIINLEKNVGKKKAIIQGVLQAKGSIFVFTDSDCILAQDSIEKVVEIFVHDKKIGAISGHGRALNADENLLTKIQDSWYETQYSIEKAFESAYGSVTCVSGPLAFFRREAIYNYFPAWENDKFLGKEFRFATDRQLTGYVLGSPYIGKKLKKQYSTSPFVKNINYPEKEWKVIYCRSAKVWTKVPNTFQKLIRQHIRWKKSFIRNIFFTGKFYWRKPIIASMKYYLGVLFTIVGPLIAIRHLIYLPLQGHALSGLFYLSGIFFTGALYGIAFKLENPKSYIWIYRPLMSIMSTLILSWLIFYSLFTIKTNIWHRG